MRLEYLEDNPGQYVRGDRHPQRVPGIRLRSGGNPPYLSLHYFNFP